MRTAIPLETKTLHFVGIGGIGMSGIAEILHNLGYCIQGSDIAESGNVTRLREKGIPVYIGQNADNLKEAGAVIISTAVKQDNPEVVAARAARLPVVRRADMLAELTRLKWSVGVAGTHGKTTTTTIVSSVLEAAHYDPTVINGGIINAYGSNTRLGQGDWMVVESDESDGTFLKVRPTIAIITNIDPEHLDYYGSYEALENAFVQFIQNVPFYGCGIVCTDNKNVQTILPRLTDRALLTYGFNGQADVMGDNLHQSINGCTFDVRIGDEVIKSLKLPMAGQHNATNALAAVAVAHRLGIGEEALRKGLANFSGVKRRFTTVGQFNQATVVDDYAHHPTEIAAVLKTARQVAGEHKTVAVFQPHRYSRLKDLWKEFSSCFNEVDTVLVCPVYAAGETPIDGIEHHTFAKALQTMGHKSVIVLDDMTQLAAKLADEVNPKDYIICMGAGDITGYAASLVDSSKAKVA